MQAVEKLKSLTEKAKLYWKTPPFGRYMTYKEILSLSVGGIGVKFIVYCINNMILSVGNTLIGNTIGINPKPLYIIYLLGILSGFPLTALRAKMIDNTRSMKGKYRPYILSMGMPTVALGIGFIWMPYEHMSLLTKCVVVLLFNIGFQFFFNFMNDAYDSLINVLSPNTIERSDVCSIKAVVENFSPSLANIFLPIAAKLITGNNTLYDLEIYRVLYPPMLIAGLLISILVYTNTEEKIVQAKTHVIQLKFMDAFRAIAHNKYFWIISLAGWLGFLEGSFNSVMGWMYNYQAACSAAQYSIITAIAGNASFWPNLVAPFFIRKYGKKKILIFTNILNIGFILLMLPIVRMTGSPSIIWLLLICTFVNQFITSLGHLLNPSLNADIRDYQQYKTGERIDGMFAAVGLIGNIITLASSFVLPILYEDAGLNTKTAVMLGYSGSNVYDVLFDGTYFIRICSFLIIASAIGAVMNVIPLFFYDLTETKQKAMVQVLKIRSLFEDYGNNALTDEALKEAIEIIEDAHKHEGIAMCKISKDEIKAARRSKDKEQLKSAKENYKKKISTNEKIEISQFILDELNRFSLPLGIAQLEMSEKIVSAGCGGYGAAGLPRIREAKGLPKITGEEKEIRRVFISVAREIRTAQKALSKYYPNGIEEFDSTVFDKLFAAEYKNEADINELVKSIAKAREAKDRKVCSALKDNLSALQQQKAEISREIKKATNQNSIYYRATKPYSDAKKLLLQKENYGHYDEIAKIYADSKVTS